MAAAAQPDGIADDAVPKGSERRAITCLIASVTMAKIHRDLLCHFPARQSANRPAQVRGSWIAKHSQGIPARAASSFHIHTLSPPAVCGVPSFRFLRPLIPSSSLSCILYFS
jgi:hypothetical protein